MNGKEAGARTRAQSCAAHKAVHARGGRRGGLTAVSITVIGSGARALFINLDPPSTFEITFFRFYHAAKTTRKCVVHTRLARKWPIFGARFMKRALALGGAGASRRRQAAALWASFFPGVSGSE